MLCCSMAGRTAPSRVVLQGAVRWSSLHLAPALGSSHILFFLLTSPHLCPDLEGLSLKYTSQWGLTFKKNCQTGIFISTSVTTLYFSWHGIFQTDFSSCLIALKLSTFVSTGKPVLVRRNSFSDWYPEKSNSADDRAGRERKHAPEHGPQQGLLELPEIPQQNPEKPLGYSEAISEIILNDFLLNIKMSHLI